MTSDTDIDELLDRAYEINQANGYNEYAEALAEGTKAANKHLGSKGLLTVSEVTEAQDELRKGHAPYVIYYKDGKPEGYLVEMADAVIRILGDVAEVLTEHPQEVGELKFSDIIKEKMTYNANRGDTAASGLKAF